MIRFEKIWLTRHFREIERIGNKVVLREGPATNKRGSPWDPIAEGRTTEHVFSTNDETVRFIESTIGDWYYARYRRVFELPPGVTPTYYRAERNRELEEAVLHEGIGGLASQVLADWLMGTGDPRGGLMQEMMRAEEAGTDKTELEERALQLLFADDMLSTVESAFLRTAYDVGDLSFSWKAGFVDTCWLKSPVHVFAPIDSESSTRALQHAIELERALLRTSSLALLRKLVLLARDGGVPTWTLEERYPTLPSSLQSFSFDRNNVNRQEDDQHFPMDSIAWIYSRVPAISNLSLDSDCAFDLGPAIALPHLRELSLVPGILSAANIRSLARSALPDLERLTLSIFSGSSLYEWDEVDFEARDMLPLFETTSLPSLKHLTIEGPMPACDDFKMLEMLLTSTLLKKLSSLALRRYVFLHTVESANTVLDLFLRHRDRLAHLDVLDLSEDWDWNAWFPEDSHDPRAAKRAAELRSLATKVIVSPCSQNPHPFSNRNDPEE